MIIRTRKSYKKRGRCFGSAAPPNAAAQTFASDGATDRNRLQFDYAFDEAEPSGGICVSIFAGFDPLPPRPGLLTLAVGSPIFGALYDKPWYCAARLRAPLIVDAEVVPLSKDGIADFDALYNRLADERLPLIERKNALRWVLRNAREGIRYVKDNDGDGQKMFDAVSKLGLEGIVSKRLSSVYRSGPSRTG